MRTLLTTLSLFLWGLASTLATNYYVRTDGSDSNAGTSNSAGGAFRTIGKACAIAQPGDIVNINDGIYVEGEIGINNKAGSKNNVLTIRAINKHKAIIQSITGGSVVSISNCTGIVVDGLEVTFQNPANSYFFGILADNSYWVTIKNCFVHDIGASGIQVNNGEYFIVENNIVRDNAKNTGNPNGSGISVYHPKYSPSYVAGDWGVIIRNNICFENTCPYPLAGYSTPVDGNGIILDDFRNEQGGGQSGGYSHPSLVENNLSFNNGGRGVHVYQSDNITVRNNTLYHNNAELSKYYAFGWNGDLNMDASTGSKVYNNIMVMNSANARGFAMLVPSDADVRNNLIIGPAGKMVSGRPQEGILSSDNQVQQLNNQSYVKFVNATTNFGSINTVNPQFSNYFGLAAGSPAIDAGTTSNTANIDQEYKSRPIGSGIDIGSYEAGTSSSDTQPPSAPTNLAASAITATSFTLSWVAATDNVAVTGYEVFRNGTSIGLTTATSFSVTGLTAGTAYSMTVRAKDAAGNSSVASNALSVTTSSASDTQAPSAPTSLNSPSKTATSVSLAWTASTDNVGVTGYDIYNGNTLAGSSNTTSFTVTNLSASTAYSFSVKARDAAGNVSPASNTLAVTTATASDSQAPSVPTNLAASSITSSGFTLSWNASTDNVGVTGYEVFRNGASIGTTASTSLAVTGLAASTAYSMSVRARDAAGNNSATSTALSVTTASGPVAGGSGLKGEFFTQFGYGVNASRSAISGQNAAFAFTATSIDYPNGSATTSTANWAAWLGGDGSGAPAESIQTSVLRLSGFIQIKPEFDIQSGNSTIDVDFQLASQGYAALTVNGSQVILDEANWAFATANARVSFPAAGYYAIEVLHGTAYDASGIELYSSIAGTSNPGRGTAQTPYIVPVSVLFKTATSTPDTQAPSAPTSLNSPSKTATSVSLAWTASTDNVGVTGYDIYNGNTLAGSSNTTSFTVTNLSASTAYSFSVKARDAAGNVSPASNTLAVTTATASDSQAPSVPTNLAASSITSSGFTLSWNASTDNVGVTGYEVFRNGASIGTTASTSLAVTGLAASTAYSMSVRARDAAGNNSATSTALSVTTASGPVAGGSGLKGEFFTQFGYGVNASRSAISGQNAAFAFTATSIDYPNGSATTSTANWAAWLGGDGSGAPAESIQTSVLRLSGFIQIKPEFDIQSGNSTIDVDFAVSSQGYMALTVNNAQVLINEENWAFGTRSTRVSFPAAGYYSIELLHSTGYDASGVELYSSIPGTVNSGHGSGLATYIVPKTVLFPQNPGARTSAETLVATELSLYPNPAAAQQTVLISSELFVNQKAMIYLKDLTGRTVSIQHNSFEGNTLKLQLNALSKGMYVILVTDGQTSQQGKLIVR